MTTSESELRTLRRDVNEKERQLRLAVAELGEATRQSLDPERWLRQRPLSCLFGALALGFWLGRR